MEIIYLDVPYAEKESAKYKGARWDPNNRKWYVYFKNAINCLKWIPDSPIKQQILNEQAIEIEKKRIADENRARENMWYNHEPRAKDVFEILKLASLSHLRPVYMRGFCQMCDSDFLDWYTDGEGTCEFRHLGDIPFSSPLYPSEVRLIEKALNDGILPTGSITRS